MPELQFGVLDYNSILFDTKAKDITLEYIGNVIVKIPSIEIVQTLTPLDSILEFFRQYHICRSKQSSHGSFQRSDVFVLKSPHAELKDWVRPLRTLENDIEPFTFVTMFKHTKETCYKVNGELRSRLNPYGKSSTFHVTCSDRNCSLVHLFVNGHKTYSVVPQKIGDQVQCRIKTRHEWVKIDTVWFQFETTTVAEGPEIKVELLEEFDISIDKCIETCIIDPFCGIVLQYLQGDLTEKTRAELINRALKHRERRNHTN